MQADDPVHSRASASDECFRRMLLPHGQQCVHVVERVSQVDGAQCDGSVGAVGGSGVVGVGVGVVGGGGSVGGGVVVGGVGAGGTLAMPDGPGFLRVRDLARDRAAEPANPR